MKTSRIIIPAGALMALILTGCATAPSPVGVGLITSVKGGITTTGNTGSKTGRACAQSILGLVNTGDASIETARKAGGITQIATVDYETTGAFPLYGKNCLIVTGS